MIIYRNTKGGFTQDVRNNLIAEKIENAFFEHCIAHNNDSEYRSWANSMEPRIHDGDYCLFETYKGGSREGKIVLAEHQGEVDSDYEGAYSIKVYHSKKVFDEFGDWQHESITLQPLNRSYDPINIDAEDADSFRIVGEFIDTIE